MKAGTKLNLKTECSWSLKNQTIILVRHDGDYIWAYRKGGGTSEYCYRIEEIEKLTWNPFIRIKRFFCRAFEC